MVLQHCLGDRPAKIDVLEDIVAQLRVALDELELDMRERAGLRQYLGGYSKLAHVVYKPRDLDPLDLLPWQAHLLGDLTTDARDPLLMAPSVGIASFDDLSDQPDDALQDQGETLVAPEDRLFRQLAFGQVEEHDNLF